MELLGAPLHITSVPYEGAPFKVETQLYTFIKNKSTSRGWRYIRIENKLQNGFPDIVLMKAFDYCLVEAKVCRKAKFNSIIDDVKWQVGQIDFFYRSIKAGCKQLVAVYHKDIVHYITGGNYVAENLPDFVRLSGLV